MIVRVEVEVVDKEYYGLSVDKVCQAFGGIQGQLRWSRCFCLYDKGDYRYVVYVLVEGIAPWVRQKLGMYVVDGFVGVRGLSIGTVNCVKGVNVVDSEGMEMESMGMVEKGGFERCW